jgi:microcystin-dependent protein
MGVVYDTDQIGTVKAFSGATIPTNWMLADGRALSRVSYPDLYTALGGTSSPWGQGDGTTSFNIPDLRSRMLVGSGAGPGLTSRAMAATGGEETHILSIGEMVSHSHRADGAAGAGGVTGFTSTDHYHSGNVGDDSPDHGHTGYTDGPAWNTGQGFNVFAAGGASNFVAITYNGVFVGGDGNKWADFVHTHNVTTYGASTRHQHHWGGVWQSTMRNTVDGNNADPNHQHAINAQGGSGAHNNMPPFVAVALIVKVTGVQVNPGGAIQGAPGQRGAIWYMYNGVGTPAPNTFVGELDGDWAIRKSDGENFERVSGAWVDQGFTNRSTAAVSACRMWRNATFAPTVANTWQKVPLDTVSFDTTSGMASAANGRVNILTAGTYQVDANIVQAVSGTGTYTSYGVAIWKNGVQVAQQYTGPAIASFGAAACSSTVQCQAGDYLELAVASSQLTNLNTPGGQGNNYLSVTLITAGPGPQGQRGTNWFTYTGAGTPAAGTFAGELDGDMAVRQSDAEVFRRVSGAWVDQGWKVNSIPLAMDPMHLVGQAGEPAFQNGWVNYPGYQAAGFRKYPDGKVRLKGLIQSGTTGTVAFTLPSGYRPPATVLDAQETNSNANGRIDVQATGGVLMNTSNPGWASLDGVEFDTETVTVMSSGPQGPKGDTGTASIADQVQTISVADMGAVTGLLCTFSSLNGNTDIEYEVILDIYTTNLAANMYCWLQPNASAAGFSRWIEHRDFTTDGSTFNSDTVGNSTSSPYGFPLGHHDWNTGGKVHAETRVNAVAYPSQGNVGRGSTYLGEFLPNALSTYIMMWRGAGVWWDSSTNITSMRIVFRDASGNAPPAGSTANGTARLRILR